MLQKHPLVECTELEQATLWTIRLQGSLRATSPAQTFRLWGFASITACHSRCVAASTKHLMETGRSATCIPIVEDVVLHQHRSSILPAPPLTPGNHTASPGYHHSKWCGATRALQSSSLCAVQGRGSRAAWDGLRGEKGCSWWGLHCHDIALSWWFQRGIGSFGANDTAPQVLLMKQFALAWRGAGLFAFCISA